MDQLKPRQEEFVKQYLKVSNGKQAAILAGFPEKSAGVQASRMLKNPLIIKYIEIQKAQLQDRTNTSLDAVLKELSAIAFSNIKNVITTSEEEIEIKDISEIEELTAKAIQEITITPTKYGVIRKVKFFNKIDALDKICKIHGYYISIYEIIDKMESSKAAEIIEEYINKKKEIKLD